MCTYSDYYSESLIMAFHTFWEGMMRWETKEALMGAFGEERSGSSIFSGHNAW